MGSVHWKLKVQRCSTLGWSSQGHYWFTEIIPPSPLPELPGPGFHRQQICLEKKKKHTQNFVAGSHSNHAQQLPSLFPPFCKDVFLRGKATHSATSETANNDISFLAISSTLDKSFQWWQFMVDWGMYKQCLRTAANVINELHLCMYTIRWISHSNMS